MSKIFLSLLAVFICCLLQAAQAQTGNCQPTINIAVQPQTLCGARTPIVVATAANAGAQPTYRWKKNGAVVGGNTSTFSGALVVGDTIVCELMPDGCPNNNIVVSNTFRFETPNLIQPEVTIAASTTNICAGERVTFTATNRSGNTNVVYLWMIDGSPVPGSNMPVFISPPAANGYRVECMMTVPQCSTPDGGSTKDYSDAININVGQVQQRTLSIATPKQQVCQGASVVFTATATGAGTNPPYLWKINGATVQTGGADFTTTSLSNGDKLQCQLEAEATSGCAPPAAVFSNELVMQVTTAETPTIAISASQADICFGTNVQFNATATKTGGNPLYQWLVNEQPTGTNGTQFSTSSLTDGDRVQCRLTTETGCGSISVASNPVAVQVRNPPAISVADDTLVIWAGEQAQLSAAITGEPHFYQWSPQASLLFDQTLEPLTKPLETSVTFTLQATALNGCVASSKIWVRVKRKLALPNAFTPNGDGINDVFRIPSGVDINLKGLSVFDRWGNAVFYTKDATAGWDGIYLNKPVPTGIYVYLLQGTYEGAPVLLKGTLMLAK